MHTFSTFIAILVVTSSAWSAFFPLNDDPLSLHHRFPSKTRTQHTKRTPSHVVDEAGAPTPQPTGTASSSTTVHINSAGDFALLLPRHPGESISGAEGDAVSFCYGSSVCQDVMPNGFITGANVTGGTSGSAHWIQVTGCIDPSKSNLSADDGGGQYDVRFPQGAQCSFGGYGASFIEQVEPSASRFCLRCCSDHNDQTNCNSHHDRDGCLLAVPGQYSFQNGVSCED
ncbi:hypothetical protein K439DRAFT_1418292 [Ramaria rubella]|nr:hypothetical protein K439DRAFT_1418292 [Ramaria rubella]